MDYEAAMAHIPGQMANTLSGNLKTISVTGVVPGIVKPDRYFRRESM